MSALVVLVIALLIQSIGCDKFDPTTHRAWHLVNDESCGIRTQQRVVGGSDAGIGEFPWVVNVLLQKEGVKDPITSCDGAIISKKFVLTAAHCQLAPDNVSVPFTTIVAGELDLSRDPDCDTNDFCPPSPKRFKVEKFIPHPVPYSDFALAKIEGEFEYDGYITPLCLEYGPLLDEDYAGDEAEFAGFGIYKIDPVTFELSTPNVLQKFTMPVQDEKGCNETLEHIVPEFVATSVFQPELFLCAGGRPGQHIYYGDSGGVLAIARSVVMTYPGFLA
ncbi:hypothetical protein LSTR_LSTR006764 [Laodelphax striatellus]|uniref:Peptidase S1 domain-containing protein n=1 Tax=Laodelphax striatellus TaxID=195883 RepID=A0A482XDT5_LAOST|nr:hypothetical protein LSTR_LSTR006764 [Laodelphax striatellus]